MSKSKTIVFKPEFEAKLKKLKIKTKFVKNFNNPKWIIPENTESYREGCLNAECWTDFINMSFSWRNSPEGFVYWYKILQS